MNKQENPKKKKRQKKDKNYCNSSSNQSKKKETKRIADFLYFRETGLGTCVTLDMSESVSYAKVAAKANGVAEADANDHLTGGEETVSSFPNDGTATTATATSGTPSLASTTDSSTEGATTNDGSDASGADSKSKTGAPLQDKKKKKAAPKPQPVYTPAPVPTVNAWSARTPASAGSNGSSSQSLNTSSSSLNGKTNASLSGGVLGGDETNWPKPDKSNGATSPTSNSPNGTSSFSPASKTIKPGKKEWIPFNPIVVSGGAKNGAGAGHGNSRASKFAGNNNNPGSSTGNSINANGNNNNFAGNNNESQGTQGAGANGHASRDRGSSPESDGRGSNARSGHRHKKGSHMNGSPNGGHHGGRKFYRDDYRRQKAQSHSPVGHNGAGAVPYIAQGGAVSFPGPMNSLEMTLGLIVTQIDYYMSVENLCKDMYLRRHMNSQGYVPLRVLARFNRVVSLTGGDYNLLVEACKWSQNGQILGESIRPIHGWENWVMPEGDRLSTGKEETGDSDNEDKTLKFNAAEAVPFVPHNQPETKS